jgi:FkbM family methyltransferase
MDLKVAARRLARRIGYDVAPFTPNWSPLARRGQLLRSLGVQVVLDVGANTGQYATELRAELGFRGRICSFEPLSAAYRVLRAQAADDPAWETFNYALGDKPGRRTINIAENSESSSLLTMLPAHVAAEPGSRTVDTAEIEVRMLDSVFDDVVDVGERVYLKVDAQGFEGHVLRGARGSLSRIGTVQMELALVALYEGEQGFFEISEMLGAEGYALIGLEPGFSDPRSGRLLQVDGIFHRDP